MHHLPLSQVYKQLHTGPQGLTASEAGRRLKIHGQNDIILHKPTPIWKLLLRQFASPLIGILLAAIIVSLYLYEYIDAVVIAVIVILNTVLGFVQEYRAERAIESLQKLARATARVIRDGKEIALDSRLLVPGDIILLQEGDKVPADARLIELFSLETQEGSLTGESTPVTKSVEMLPEKTPLAERANMVFASTLITKGKAKVLVVATGMHTEVGKIASLIQIPEEKETPLKQKLTRMSTFLTVTVMSIAVIIFGFGIVQGKNAEVMFLTALALAVAAIPEGLPAVATISLAVGVRRMASRHALVRRLTSVETLGSVTTICVDKTGTLTYNEMTVTHLWMNRKFYTVSGSGFETTGKFSPSQQEILPLLKIGLLCNNASITTHRGKVQTMGDPTEIALLIAGMKANITKQSAEKKEPFLYEIPFSSERKMMTVIRDSKISYTKGAPEVVLRHCSRVLLQGKVVPLTPALRKEILARNEEYTASALRVLGFAYNDSFSSYDRVEKGMIFVGLQGMIDPPRVGVKEALQKCAQAGIRVIMITGDHLNTAKAIAQELGFSGKAVSGEELERINLDQEISHINIFARVNPEHKLKIIRALKRKGHIVAMTGDGVNDAPALKKADIGVAMGITGTEVAKEAADIILTNDHFVSIVNAVEEGRGIYDNIRKFFAFLFSGNIGEVGIITFSLLTALPLPLTPLLILFINLVTDGLPAIALSVDPFEPHALDRPPRSRKENFYQGLSSYIVYYPLLMVVTALSFFGVVLGRTGDLAKAQTTTFLVVVLFELYQAFSCRSVRYPVWEVGAFKNRYLIAAVLGSFLATVAVIYIPFFQSIFGTVSLTVSEFVVVGIVSSIGFVYLELDKWRKEG